MATVIVLLVFWRLQCGRS